MRAGKPKPFRIGMKTSTPHVNIKHTPNAKSDKNQHTSMSEPGKMKEGRDYDMNLYPMSCKAGTGLDSDRLPQGLRECTLAEIKSSVVEAGNHEVLASGSSLNEISA